MSQIITVRRLCIVLLILSLGSCQHPVEQEESNPDQLHRIFTALTADQSGIDFTNNLMEDSVVNYFTYPYIYMGGGVAIGDLNNDGLQDLYFTGNQVQNKLYLNQGGLDFKDITVQAGVAGDERWDTGVTMADVNHDGWMDIYVSVSGKWTSAKNQLYLNQGTDDSGIPRFVEAAEEAGIADEGSSTQATFFDFDKDGDLDLYVANYPFTSFKTQNSTYRFLMDRKRHDKSDHFYENQGDGTFKDITEAANLLNFGLALGIVVDDFNLDGWEDIYVSNDFATPDYFYFNNGDGTFSEKARETTMHTSFFGMGIDAGDLNNDGLVDLVQMDMTPADNFRNKANMASMNPRAFYGMINYGMHYQYMQNAIQLNQGINNSGYPHFSDIARFTGMSSTDWSWAGLIADLDNDGWNDVFITNGTRKDINNKDYFAKIDKATHEEKQQFDWLELSKKIPSDRIDNYAFKNNGDLSFTSVIEPWGLSYEGYTNGAAYSDLDNDGDLEIIINNIDDQSLVFENHTVDYNLGNYLKIALRGPLQNPNGLGSTVTLETNGIKQRHHYTLTRGFQSSVEPVIHFGLGKAETADQITIDWPDGKRETILNVEVNQTIELDHRNAVDFNRELVQPDRVFTDLTKELALDHRHQENAFNDFQYEVLLPHIYSRNGPGLAVGDVNGDHMEDFYVGGANGFPGALFIQQQSGGFTKSPYQETWRIDTAYEDMGAAFFDADQDGDQDLYVISGGNEHLEGSSNLQDRLYINDGNGRFSRDSKALPEMHTSGSRVKVSDFDNDGDMDLFVGGRLVPRSYPLPARSYLLRNEGTISGGPKFKDVTEEMAPMLLEAGMVTDAAWTDFDNDGNLDLVVVGEWMPITFLKHENGIFQDKTIEYGLDKTTGWWYSILADDFDADGDPDLVAGNLGQNYKYQASEKESFDVYANDYDKNGHLDIVLGYYNDGTQYPLRGRECSSQQIPAIKVKFEDYNSFAQATLQDVYSEGDLNASLHYQAHTFASSYLENNGNGSFSVNKLPNEAQLSSINGIVSGDFNQDQNLDLVVAGNMYNAEVETTRNDAGYGMLLYGDGAGNFEPVPYSESGLYIPHNTKDLKSITGKNCHFILAGNNNDQLKILRWSANLPNRSLAKN